MRTPKPFDVAIVEEILALDALVSKRAWSYSLDITWWLCIRTTILDDYKKGRSLSGGGAQ